MKIDLSDIPATLKTPSGTASYVNLEKLADTTGTDVARLPHTVKILLLEQGVPVAEFNSFGSRRGNHEVMIRGTFGNIRLRNAMAPGTGHRAPGTGLRAPRVRGPCTCRVAKR